MRKIKTWLRTSIQQQKCNELSILYIEKDKTKLLNNDTILNIFEKKCNITCKIKLKMAIVFYFSFVLVVF